jgi:hypothetical protein
MTPECEECGEPADIAWSGDGEHGHRTFILAAESGEVIEGNYVR